MEKIYGTTIRQDGLQRIGRDTWVLFFGLYETTDGGTYEYRHTFKHRPTLDEIKAVINAQLSADADERKRNGFSWQGVPVRYDEEAERNITGLSVKIPRLGAAMFPLQFKLGDYPDGSLLSMSSRTQKNLRVSRTLFCCSRRNAMRRRGKPKRK